MVAALLGLVLAVLMQATGSARHLDGLADRDLPDYFHERNAAP